MVSMAVVGNLGLIRAKQRVHYYRAGHVMLFCLCIVTGGVLS
ncbi:hypothetical protein BMS3Bbin04_01386 [bacterium BMS3Bbin04]|nr:hypothetical protein BMS3Bbin04_01386 [bacterium BMS3Bbin04]